MFQKLKELSKDTAIYGISTMVGRFLTFLLVPLYTNVFIKSDYGVVVNIYFFIAVMNVVFIYGMDSAFLKYSSKIKIGDKKDNFSTPYLSVIIVGVILFFTILLSKFNLAVILSIPSKYIYLLNYAAVILFVDALAVIPFIKLRLERKAKKFAAFKIINISVNVILNLYLILILKFDIEAILIANLIASILTYLLLFPSVIKNLRFRINRELFKSLLKFGLPYFPAGLGAMLIQGIDRPILGHLTNLGTVGVYSANYKLGIFMMLFVSMFQFAWQPFFLQNENEKNAKDIFSKVFTYFALAGSFVLVFISLFISDIIKINIFGHSIIGSAYWGGLNIVPIILLGYLFYGFYFVFIAGIYIKEKSIYVLFIALGGALINILSNFILIPIYGMIGAALSTLASYLFMAAALLIVTQKFYKIKYEFFRVGKIFLGIFIIAIVYYWTLDSGEITITFKVLLALLFIIYIFIFVINKQEIRVLKEKLFKSA